MLSSDQLPAYLLENGFGNWKRFILVMKPVNVITPPTIDGKVIWYPSMVGSPYREYFPFAEWMFSSRISLALGIGFNCHHQRLVIPNENG